MAGTDLPPFNDYPAGNRSGPPQQWKQAPRQWAKRLSGLGYWGGTGEWKVDIHHSSVACVALSVRVLPLQVMASHAVP